MKEVFIVSKKIMLVDDSSFMRLMLRKILEVNGYTVVCEAANGLEAVEFYKTHTPDLVTMDITMDQLDGIGALIEIKKMDPNAKVIMCSAMGQQAMVMESLKAGAIDFIVKPFNADRVIHSIKSVIGE